MRVSRANTTTGCRAPSRFEQAARAAGGQVEQVIVGLNGIGRDLPRPDITLRQNAVSLLQRLADRGVAPTRIELQHFERSRKPTPYPLPPGFEIGLSEFCRSRADRPAGRRCNHQRPSRIRRRSWCHMLAQRVDDSTAVQSRCARLQPRGERHHARLPRNSNRRPGFRYPSSRARRRSAGTMKSTDILPQLARSAGRTKSSAEVTTSMLSRSRARRENRFAIDIAPIVARGNNKQHLRMRARRARKTGPVFGAITAQRHSQNAKPGGHWRARPAPACATCPGADSDRAPARFPALRATAATHCAYRGAAQKSRS